MSTLSILRFSIAAASVLVGMNAYADDRKALVYGDQGTPVRSAAFQNCVRTDWDNPSDPCAAPVPEPAPVAYVPSPPLLSTQQRVVYFDFNSTQIPANSTQQLDEVAGLLNRAEDVRYTKIVGYADRIGNTGYNQSLSLKRAQAVQAYLASKGYHKTQPDVRALGESQPTAACEGTLSREQQIACLSPDRRVELEVQYTDR